MSDTALLLKHHCQLSRNIASLSDGQARVEESTTDGDDLTTVCVSIAPRSGPYRGGKFDFQLDLSDGYPTCPPAVRAVTQMYHPNVDLAGEEGEDDGTVCLNLLDELWAPGMTLEDAVQGLMFLLHYPNLDDPLSSLFCGSEDEREFLRDVRRSLRGGEVAGVTFERNLVDGCESECEEDDEEAPGNLAPAPDVEVDTNEEEMSTRTEATPANSAANSENQKLFISTLDALVEADESLENDTSSDIDTSHQTPSLSPSLPSRHSTLDTSFLPHGTFAEREKLCPLFSQLNSPLCAFDKMWTLSLSSTVRTIVLGVQRSPPLARLDSAELDVH